MTFQGSTGPEAEESLAKGLEGESSEEEIEKSELEFRKLERAEVSTVEMPESGMAEGSDLG